MAIIEHRYPAHLLPAINRSEESFEFISEGPKGKVKLTAVFEIAVDQPWRVDFGFGINTGLVNPETGRLKFDDKRRMNNNDKDRIFATVAELTYSYLKRNPGKYVSFQGSTPSRNREYQMTISTNIAVLESYVRIFGVTNDNQTVPFLRNSLPYQGFFIGLK